MWQEYAPDPRMKLNLGIRRRLAPLLENDRRKIELAYSLLFTLPGSPIIYYGDEIGMGDNIWLEDRNGVRTVMQWQAGPTAGFSEADPVYLFAPVIDDDVYGNDRVNVEAQRHDPTSLWMSIRAMIAARKHGPQFGRGNFEWVELPNPQIAAFKRTYQDKSVLALHNLSDSTQAISLARQQFSKTLTDILTSKRYDPLAFELTPYEYVWLIDE